MKRKTRFAILLPFLLLAAACGHPSGSGPTGTVSGGPAHENANQASDSFTFRDADTGKVIPEQALPGHMYDAKFSYMSSTPAKWTNGVIKWWYNPSGAPAGFDTQKTIDALIAAGKRWEAVCKVSFQFQGTTANPLKLSGCDGNTVVGWTPLSGSTIGQTQDCVSGSSIGEMDLGLDNSQISSLSLMQDVATHEMGHAFGLGHTDISPAVMTPYLTTGIPVQDDIDGCQSLYGPPSTTTAPAPICTAGATQNCTVSNGTGTQTCSADGSNWGTCKATTCSSGYTLSNGTCVSQTQPTTQVCQPNTQKYCSSFSGTGYRTCSADGSSWSACKITQCKTGFKMVNGQCRWGY